MSSCSVQHFCISGGLRHHKYFRPKLNIFQRHILIILFLGTIGNLVESESVTENAGASESEFSDRVAKGISKVIFTNQQQSTIDKRTYGFPTSANNRRIPQVSGKSIPPNFHKTFPGSGQLSVMQTVNRTLLFNRKNSTQRNETIFLAAKCVRSFGILALDSSQRSQGLVSISSKRFLLASCLENLLKSSTENEVKNVSSFRSRERWIKFVSKRSLGELETTLLPTLGSVEDNNDTFVAENPMLENLTAISAVIEDIVSAFNISTSEDHFSVWQDLNTGESVVVHPFQSKRGKDNVIYIHGQFEISNGDCRPYPRAGPFEFKAAELAIRHINEKNIIPGFQLEMYVNDSKCDSGVAVDSFFYSLYRQPTMTMMLGTGSSEVTERLARVVSRWNIIQVSYGAISPALSDRKNFPFFFRTVAPDSSHNAAILAFVQHFRWDTVATLHEQGDNHALPMNKLVTDLEQANISVSFTKGLSEKDYKEHLQELKDQDCRIFIGSFSYQLVRKIFCHIYHLKMFGAEYVWILQGDLKTAWWRNVTATECTRTQLAKAAMGVLIVGSYYGHESNETTLAGVTAKDLLNEIGFHTQLKNSGFVSQAYDAVWALALALEQTEREYKETKSNISINQFSYSDFEMTQQIANVLGKLKFTGVSGPVSFHNSDRVCITSFHQNQGRKELQLVFLHYPEAEDINFECKECVKITWQGNKVPIARRIIRLRVAVLARGVLICVTSLAVFGVILALTFLSFNLYYRKLKFIKLSSPNLNNFVLVGCVLVYVAMILLGMDHSSLTSDNHFKIVCSARAFLLSGGFSVAFGCMFIKTYRVYHIFIRSNTGIVKSKLLHDQQLLAMVSVLVLVDCILVTLWVTLDPMERHLRNLTMQVNPSERNVVYLYQREQCYSTHMAKWLGSLYIYKGLLLVVGCYMAWETRHVKIPALNDSQYIGMSVYNVVITSTLVVALANVIPVERYTLTFVLVSTLIFVSTTMTICLLFVPKIHTIMTRIDDEGAIVATPGVKVEYKTRRFAIDESRESMYRAEVLNRALKRELMELEAELTRLSEKAGIVPPMRKSLELLQQDDDSDDDLPPWLADYKKYPPRSNVEGVWYSRSKKETDSGACFSVLSAVHPLLLSAVDRPSAVEEKNISKSADHTQGDKTSSASKSTRKSSIMRSSLPTITLADCSQKLSAPVTLDQVRTCASDRALNRIKNVSKPTMSKIANWSLGKLNCNQASEPLKSQKSSQVKSFFSKSASRLQNSWNQSSSLPKIISSVESSHQSLCSGHTNSLESDWATATLYSSSFATAQEDASSNSNTNNNHVLMTPPQSPRHFSLPRDSLTDSTSSNGPFFTDNSSSSGGGKNENPFGSSIKRKPMHFRTQDIANSNSTSAHYYPQTKSSTTSSDSNNATNQYYPSSSSNGSNLADDQDVFFNCDSNDVTPSNDDELVSLLPQEPALIKNTADSSTHSGFLSKFSDTSSKSSFLELEDIDCDKGTPTNSRTLMTQSSSSEETSVMEESDLYASTAQRLKHSTSAGNISNITLSANFSNTAKNVYDSATLGSCTVSSYNNNNEDTTRSLLIESDNVATSGNAETENNNSASESGSDRENIRQQIFQLERDLILLDLEKSDAIDL